MSNWLLHAAEDWLSPIYDTLHKQLCQQTVLHGDETTLQVLKEPGKAAVSKSYMWLYRTSGDAEHPIVLYDYQPNCKAENAEKFLEGFTGWLHADGYQGYHKLPQRIRVVGCWAHAQRKFDEALHTVPKEQQRTSKPAQALCYFAKLFELEQQFADMMTEVFPTCCGVDVHKTFLVATIITTPADSLQPHYQKEPFCRLASGTRLPGCLHGVYWEVLGSCIQHPRKARHSCRDCQPQMGKGCQGKQG